MSVGLKGVQQRTLEGILNVHGLSLATLPPANPIVLHNLIQTVGPVEESLASTAVYLTRELGTPTGMRVRIGRKTYDFQKLPRDINHYELPLSEGDNASAAVVFGNDPFYFSPSTASVIAQVVPTLRVFAHNGLEYLKATLRPAYDGLTKLPNREAILNEFAYAQANSEDATLQGEFGGIGFILFDIDKFKDYNDTFGHKAGDDALVAMGGYLRETVRETDSCGRWGGEEFAVGTFGATREKTVEIAERIRKTVEERSLADVAAGLLPRAFTVTGGVAHSSEVDPGLADFTDGLYRKADDRLYRAKKNHDGLSRNKISSRYDKDRVDTSQ